MSGVLCPRCGDPGSLDCPDRLCPIVRGALARANERSDASYRHKEGGRNKPGPSDLERFARDDTTSGERPRRHHKGPEYALQVKIACWLYTALEGADGVLWTSIDTNFAVKRKVAFFRKVRGIKPGIPDFMFIRSERVRFIELKVSKRTRPSKAQKGVFKKLDAAGVLWAVCYSGEEVEQALRRWRFPLACPYRGDFPIPDEWKSTPKRLEVRQMTPAEKARVAARWRELPPLQSPEEFRRAWSAAESATNGEDKWTR